MHAALNEKSLDSEPVLSDFSCLRVAGGSDAPIETPNPFTGMFDAIFRSDAHRRTRTDQGGDVLHPEQCLTFSQALWMYTIGNAHSLSSFEVFFTEFVTFSGGAYASETENKLGQISPGFIGDLVLVDPAILDDPQRLLGYKPDLVLIGGRISAANSYRFESSSDTSSMPNICANGSQVPVIRYRLEGDSWHLPSAVLHDGLPAAIGHDLSNALFLPGRNGASTMPPLDSAAFCTPINSRQVFGIKCACILKGKYCF
jgi:hypothetical protein